MLLDGSKPLVLRPYQSECAAECAHRNVLCALPVGSGKTVVAAEVISQALAAHDEKKVVFLAPYGQLALQQFLLLLRQIDRLHAGENMNPKADLTPAERARWRAGLVVGQSLGEATSSWRSAFIDFQLLVMTPHQLEKALMHACVSMSDMALLVFDEAHHARQNTFFSTIMNYFYHPTPAPRRPRVLGLTASPAYMPDAEQMAKLETRAEKAARHPEELMREEVIAQLDTLEHMLDARVWSASVSIEAANERAPRWAGDFTLECYERSEQLPLLAHDVLEIVRQCRPSGENSLAKIWEPRIVSKIERVASDLGAWACFKSAQLLANDLQHARLHEGVYFEAEEQAQFQSITQTNIEQQHAIGQRLAWTLSPLEARLPQPTEAAAHSDKVRQLVQYLTQQQPRKCLVFVARRVVARLLSDLLAHILPWSPTPSPFDWTVDCVMAVSLKYRHKEAFSASEHTQAIQAFRRDLRLLVATSTVDEGLDVPACDCVVNFDAPTTARALLQRGGRARAPGSLYATLVEAGDQKAEAEQQRMLKWNQLIHEQLHALRTRGAQPPLFGPQDGVDLERDALRIEKTGALLPVQRAPDFLKTVVYRGYVWMNGESVELHATGDCEKYSSSKYITYDHQPLGGFSCTIQLPWVTLCSAKPDAELLPYTIRLPTRFSNKGDAERYTALAALRHLHVIGVLDEWLHVVGRAEALASIAENGRNPRRASRLTSAYESSLREPVVRRMPKCFQLPHQGECESCHAYIHTLSLDGAATGLGLVLASPCALPPFQLGPEGKPRRECEVQCTTGSDIRLSREQLTALAECHVAMLDLTQAGNAHEPLHPQIHAPQQLVRWNFDAGTYSPERIDESDEMASAASDGGGQSDSLSQPLAGLGGDARLAKLLELLATFVKGDSRLVPVFDLDMTLWAGNCDEWHEGCFVRWPEPSQEGRLQVYEDSIGFLELFEDVPLIFAALRRLGAPFAIASASGAHGTARALLAAFGLEPDSLIIEMRMPDDDERGKEQMLQRLSKRLGAAVDSLVLFDDRTENLKDARALGCGGRLIDRTVGLTAAALLEGLTFHRSERHERERSELDADGFTATERKETNHEKRRKMQQKRRGAEGERHAHADEAPAQARLAKLSTDPPWWLVVPLHTADSGDASGDAINWAHVQHVRESCTACDWPSLDALDHPLVAPHYHALPADATAPEAGEERAIARLDLCTLMSYAPPTTGAHMHADLFTAVVLHANGTVSGEKRSRGINVSSTAATRTQQADGRHVTQHTLHRTGYSRERAFVLPLRSTHVDGLQCIRRVVWRLQHLALACELDGLHSLQGSTRKEWLPEGAVPVPLPLVVAALTHCGAGAEAPEARPANAADAALWALNKHGEQTGCTDYEVLEWAGDAVLDLLSKSWVMAQHPTEFKKLQAEAQLLLDNKPLWRRAKALDVPPLALYGPFKARAHLAEMTKQLVAPKAQADLMEAMLGAVCQAQIQQVAGEHSSELARGLDAALAFFRTFLCRDDVASPHNSDSSASMLLCATMATVRRAPGCDAHGQERAGDLEAAYGLQFTRRPDLLHECCTWNNGKAFQRLEYLGDAFLQCTPPPRPWLNTHDVVALTQSC